MNTRIKRLAATFAPVLIGGTIAAAVAAVPASATTPACLGTQNPVSGPISCGGLYLPGMDPSPAGQPNAGTLTLTAASASWNAPLTFSLYTGVSATQDFTLSEVCNGFNSSGRTDTNPCGTGFAPVNNVASGRPEFVAEDTPNGAHLGGSLNNLSNLCISEEGLHNGPHGALRWNMVLRTCDSLGATFYPPVADGGSGGTGIPGVVTSPNPWQTFAAVPVPGGDSIVNDQLSNNFHNTLYAVNDKGVAYPNGIAIVYPATGSAKNEVAAFVGCNGAVLTTGVNSVCP